MDNNGNRTRNLLIGLLVLCPAVLARFLQPLAFPFVFIDEALYNMGPKNAVLIHDPLAFSVGHVFLSPAHYATTLLAYHLFSPSLELSRILTALFGTGSIFFVYLLGKRFADSRTAFFAALLCAYNSLLIYMSRLATLETEVTFYMLGATFFWFHGNRRLVWISGLFLAAALLIKLYAASLILILPLCLAFQKSSENTKWFSLKRIKSRHWLALCLGIAAAVAGYAVIAQLDPELFMKAWAAHSLKRIQYHPLHFARDFARHFPDLLLLAGLGVLSYLKSRREGVLILTIWLAGFLLAIEAQDYLPTRYFYPSIPILTLLAAFTLRHLEIWFGGYLKRSVLYALIAIMCAFQLYRLFPYYSEGSRINHSFAEATAWVESNLEPNEPVLTFNEAGILMDRLTIPYQRMYSLESEAFDSLFLSYQPQIRYAILTDVGVDDRQGKTTRLYEFLESNHYQFHRKFGFINVFLRADSTVGRTSLKLDYSDPDDRTPWISPQPL